MPQAILYVDAQERATRGFGAPKRAGDLQHWIKKINQTFKGELAKEGVQVLGAPFAHRVTEDEIRITWLRHTPMTQTTQYISVYVDRRANGLAR